MAEYQGQPGYVVVGYQSDLFAPWAQACPNDEWGEFMASLHELIERCISVSDEERALVLVGWFRDELQRAFDANWWDVNYEWEDWAPIYEAQDYFNEITAYWRKRAVSFKGEAALEEIIAGLPNWIRPQPDRLIKPDPERAQYERLKEKFEG